LNAFLEAAPFALFRLFRDFFRDAFLLKTRRYRNFYRNYFLPH